MARGRSADVKVSAFWLSTSVHGEEEIRTGTTQKASTKWKKSSVTHGTRTKKTNLPLHYRCPPTTLPNATTACVLGHMDDMLTRPEYTYFVVWHPAFYGEGFPDFGQLRTRPEPHSPSPTISGTIQITKLEYNASTVPK